MFEIINKLSQLKHWQSNHQLESSSINMDTFNIVSDIQKQIIANKDAALKAFTQQFDNVDIENIQVTHTEIKSAYNHVDQNYINALKSAAKNIDGYHQKQVPNDWEDSTPNRIYGVQHTALESVGLYVPGGRAAYPSSVLMSAIPAKIAGCERIVMVSPPTGGDIPPAVLVAADIAGITEVYRVGGAQAVFALAHGTQSIQAVDKIVGPGNKYVTAAKQMVYGRVDIDKPAGPSEVCVAIDSIDYAAYAAAECLAQLEHDPDASAIVITTSNDIAAAVNHHATEQLKTLKRQDIINQSKQHAVIVVVDSEDELLQSINQAASEHLVLLVSEPNILRSQVRHAGSIFCGPYSPVSLGDYYAGPNHVLPTARSARFASPLGVMDFMKYSSYLEYSKQALKNAQSDIQALTLAEGFDAHYQAVAVRFNNG